MKILNFGSLNYDIVFSVEHFVKPGETISALKTEKFCGGKGLNQSVALAKAGATVYHAGCVGNDGQMLLDFLNSSGVNTDYIHTADCSSGQAIIQVENSGQNSIILSAGSNAEVTPEIIDRVLNEFSPGDFLLLQNEISNIRYIVDKAYEKGMVIALNPSPMNEKILKLPLNKISYIILNEIEGNDLTGKENPDEIIDDLISRLSIRSVVLTLGKRGAVFSDGKETCSNGIYDVKVVDTTAAGDTFTGFFLASVLKGNSPDQSLKLASLASSIAVTIKGAACSIPTISQVIEFENSLL